MKTRDLVTLARVANSRANLLLPDGTLLDHLYGRVSLATKRPIHPVARWKQGVIEERGHLKTWQRTNRLCPYNLASDLTNISLFVGLNDDWSWSLWLAFISLTQLTHRGSAWRRYGISEHGWRKLRLWQTRLAVKGKLCLYVCFVAMSGGIV